MKAEDWLAVPSRTKGREATTGVIPGRFALSVGHPALPTPPGWKWTKLSDVARLESGHTPSRKHPEYWDGDVPWIGIKDAVDNHGRTINNTYQHVTELGLANSSARLLPKNTVCLSRTASIGYVTVMGRPMATSQDFVNWVCSDEIEPQFLKAILIAEHESLWRFASGTTHQTIYYPEVKAFHVCLPPIQEQRAIAHILGTLDDKIELNQQMNGTLEAIARAIFKSWFVDFDPVRAKMDGRQPAEMDAATANLFPDEFEESPLGKIPKGWKVTTLGDVVSIKHGYAFKSEFFSEPAPRVPIVVNIGNFKYTGGFRFESTTLKGYVGEFPEEFILYPGDILLVMTCQTAGGEILGIPGRIPNDGRTYLHNQRMGKVVVTDSDKVDQHFLYQLFLLPEFNRELFATASGTKILHTSPSRIEAFQFCLPPILVQRSIAKVLKNLEVKIASNEMESKILTNLRDVLLPKLLAGEIQVKDAEKLLAASM